MPNSKITPDEALRRIIDGNKRFVAGHPTAKTFGTQDERIDLAENGQAPFAVILGCADSRVPAEYIFDLGFGDLFVVRVAGNIVAPSLLGSIEFAASQLGTPLCIVLGHTQCGAVYATTDIIQSQKEAPTDHTRQIVEAITPSVEKVMRDDISLQGVKVVAEQAIRCNVMTSMRQILERSGVIRELTASGKFRVVGGVYNLHSGQVEIFEQDA